MPEFCHLHNHTQFSLLDGASDITALMKKAAADGQKGVAMTDHGNMFGAFKFAAEATKHQLKPILGCEFYLVEDRFKQSFSRSKGESDRRYHQLMLAKNATGYKNLMKLTSLGYIDGLYGKYPRIDKELIEQYSEGVIATSCCLGAEIPQAILHGDLEKAESLVKWWKDLLGEDFYIELQRHRGLENINGTGVSQEDINQTLIQLAKKYDLKTISTNDAHYLNEEDWKPHDILLCVNTAQLISETQRFKFPSSDFFFKTQEEMNTLFADVPESVDYTMEIFDKVDHLNLARDIILPTFPLPEGFVTQADYLRHLVEKGAKWRYPNMTDEIRHRLEYELDIISKMGFEGYFLIVQDFIIAARELGVSVGPGRGSAAGSAVAYCLTITDVDPIKYNLLFERFLNPERQSMPDIDIDFDDDGRQSVIDWVVDKYGRNQVAQIITFNTMAARSAIRDVARVLDLPLQEADKIAKLVPAKPGISLKKILDEEVDLKKEFKSEEAETIEVLRNIKNTDTLAGETLKLAEKLEGSVRNSGVHAAGVIIAPEDITNFIPVFTNKDTNLLITQFDGSVVESAGMLKMDFLGLKTLSIIKDAIENIVLRYGEEKRIDPRNIPLDDELTFELFQRGEMTGIFQFESEGMRKHLRDLKPTNIEDLIAMTALYRPGPMDYIPQFINRKQGREAVVYPHEWLEELLKPTYGIMVYQEQIMQTAQIMAGYSLGKADMLRRAMGKKKHEVMKEHRKIFIDGAKEKGIDEKKANDIFDIMAKFASYGFNRSHAAAYSVVSFQTAYLKAHYPAEFMASVLTHNKNDITKLNFFLRECKRMNIEVLPPDVNESSIFFSVNQKGQIRFGLSALKGVGEGPVEAIISERKSGGPFTSIFNMTQRLDSRAVNKKCYESLIFGGAMDAFGAKRAQYFAPSGKFATALEHAIKFGSQVQRLKEESVNTLFGMSEVAQIQEPALPEAEEWPLIHRLEKEKSVAGIYLSGHPLDTFRLEMDHFINTRLNQLDKRPDQLVTIAGIVVKANHRISKKGTAYGQFKIEDYYGGLELSLFSNDYLQFKNFFNEGAIIYLEGRYAKKWNNEEERTFKLSKAGTLESLNERITEITLLLPLENINNRLIEDIAAACEQHKGQHRLKCMVVDRKNKLKLTFASENTKVAVDQDLVDVFHNMGISSRIASSKS